jgi:hypothetical protein
MIEHYKKYRMSCLFKIRKMMFGFGDDVLLHLFLIASCRAK